MIAHSDDHINWLLENVSRGKYTPIWIPSYFDMIDSQYKFFKRFPLETRMEEIRKKYYEN